VKTPTWLPRHRVSIAFLAVIACLAAAIALLFWLDSKQDKAIQELASANKGNETAVALLCERKPLDPTCRSAEKIPSTAEIIDDAEVQEPEIQESEIQESEVQDREVQDGEAQEDEAQEAETQESEIQDADPNDPDPVDDPDPNDPDPIDDPDPNSVLQFAVDDSCSAEVGMAIVDVGLEVRRGDGTVTYVITCTKAPASPVQ
jgi:hypothetical protein